MTKKKKNPIENVDVLVDIFSRDPELNTDKDIDMAVSYYIKDRRKWQEEVQASKTKKADKTEKESQKALNSLAE